MALTTFNNIIDSLITCATRPNSPIKEVFKGSLAEMQSLQHSYPLMVIITEPSKILWGSYEVVLSVFIMDVMRQDRSNVYEIESDCLQIIGDLVSEFRDQQSTYGYWMDETPVEVTPFEEKTDDYLCGWSAKLTVRYINSFDQTQSTLNNS